MASLSPVLITRKQVYDYMNELFPNRIVYSTSLVNNITIRFPSLIQTEKWKKCVYVQVQRLIKLINKNGTTTEVLSEPFWPIEVEQPQEIQSLKRLLFNVYKNKISVKVYIKQVMVTGSCGIFNYISPIKLYHMTIFIIYGCTATLNKFDKDSIFGLIL